MAIILSQKASKNRIVGDLAIVDSTDPDVWEAAYQQIMDKKYAKGTRKFTLYEPPQNYTKVMGAEPPIYLIPRVRAGPSYKSVELNGAEKEQIMYAAVSKGYPGQDVSSFTVGPIIGHGLCLVNAAFSKSICLFHLRGGVTDLSRRNFWRPVPKSKQRKILRLDDYNIMVDGTSYNTIEWLQNHEDLWYAEWDKWRRSIAMCSMGDFHWSDDVDHPVMYRNGQDYLNFVQWKIQCYVQPAYDMLPTIVTFQMLKHAWNDGFALGLVHPKACKGVAEDPMTKEFLTDLIHSPKIMACMPYLVAACIMDVPL